MSDKKYKISLRINEEELAIVNALSKHYGEDVSTSIRLALKAFVKARKIKVGEE